jgi:hypothetical protein
MSVETRNSVDAGFELPDERSVIEGRGHLQAPAALQREKYTVRHTQQFAHRGKVMAA